MKKLFVGIFLGLFFAGRILAAEFPQPTGYVNDFGEIFSVEFQQELEQELANFEKETTAEISVVAIKSLGSETIESYAVRLFEQWGIGKKKEDNGVLLLISSDDREMRIEVGYGLEPVITDGRAGRIIREQLRPSFKEENYEEGVKLAIAQLKEYIISGEPPQAGELVEEKIADFFGLAVFGMIFLVWFFSFLGRSKEFVTGGIIGGLFGGLLGLITGGLLMILSMAVLLGVVGLLLDFLLSRNYKKLKAAGRATGFWPSRGGFSSGGKSGFSGFSGGSSGGGGASGGW